MSKNPVGSNRLPRIVAISRGRHASAELGTCYPFAALSADQKCDFRWVDSRYVSSADLAWGDLVVMVRPHFPEAWLAIKQARNLGRTVLAYWDDDYTKLPNISWDHTFLTHPALRQMQDECLAVSDGILTCSERVAGTLFKMSGQRAIVLPVPAIAPLSSIAERRVSPRRFKLGYAGSAGHFRALEDILIPALSALWDEGLDIEFEVIGPRPKIPDRFQQFVIQRPAVEFSIWPQLRNGLDWHIAVAPLSHSEFNASKFHNKFIEYGAAGIPCVFSDVAPYASVIEHGLNGWLVKNTPGAWQTIIRELYHSSPCALRVIGGNSLSQVQAQNSIDAVARTYFERLSVFFELQPVCQSTNHDPLKLQRNWMWVRFLPLRVISFAAYAKSIGASQTIASIARRLLKLTKQSGKNG